MGETTEKRVGVGYTLVSRRYLKHMLWLTLLFFTACESFTQNPDVSLSSQASIEVRVSSGTDDAEEHSGDMSLSSSDLELTTDDEEQTIGIRFDGIDIPQGATVTNAYVQFTTDETDDDPTRLNVVAQAHDDAPTFASRDKNISSRATTRAGVAWSPAPWKRKGEAGPDQRTPNLAAVLQEVVDRPGWESGNALALVVTGSGQRTAESYNGERDKAPVLHVEYEGAEGVDNSAPSVDAGEDQVVELPSAAVLDGDVQDDGLPEDALSVVWHKVNGPGDVSFKDATQEDTSAYFSEAGTYTLSLTADDGLLSESDQVEVTVREVEEETFSEPADPIFERQGYGADTRGGEGGKIYEVRDLNSLKTALAATGPRIIRQTTSEPILTDTSLEIRNPYVTLENLYVYNEPGAEDHTLAISTHDVIITNSRLYNPVQAQKDVVSIKKGAYNILFERSTILFGGDETVNSWYDAHDITFAWNIIAYPLDYDDHGYGPLFGAADRNGRNVAFHHNLISTSRYRNPKADILGGFLMWNNVIYNCDSMTLLQPNAPGDFLAVLRGNYYKSGPQTGDRRPIEAEEHGDLYLSGNTFDGRAVGWSDIEVEGDVRQLSSLPSGLPEMTVTSAERAYKDVLTYAGANYNARSSLVKQIVKDVRNGGSQVPAGQGWIHSPSDVGF